MLVYEGRLGGISSAFIPSISRHGGGRVPFSNIHFPSVENGRGGRKSERVGGRQIDRGRERDREKR